MLEARQTNRFAFIFFLYFTAASFTLNIFPVFSSFSYVELMIANYTLCFLPFICFYFIFTKKPLRKTLRLNWLGWKNLLLVILLAFAAQPLMMFFSFFTELFFENPVTAVLDFLASSNFFAVLFAIAVMPAVFEEIVMRGIFLSGYRAFHPAKAAFAVAFLFALFHMNPQQFLYTFSFGLLFCIFVHRTNSIFASVIPHFIINSISVFSIFSAESDALMPSPPMTVLFLSVSLLALLSLPIFAGLLYLFFKINPLPLPSENKDALTDIGLEEPAPKARFFTPSTILLCIFSLALTFLPYL